MAATRVRIDPSGEIRVSLGAEDFALAQRVGRVRTDEARDAECPGRAGCQAGNVRQDFDGSAAEVAFARAIGVPPKLSTTPDPGPDIGGS
jgi:hypothetical protein